MELNKLLPDYYDIVDRCSEVGHDVFSIRMNPDCSVYKGHFPGHPICPGVCNIQMIKECVQQVCEKPVTFSDIKKCRFTSLMTPEKFPEVKVDVQISDKTPNQVSAQLYDGETVILEIKGDFCDSLNA